MGPDNENVFLDSECSQMTLKKLKKSETYSYEEFLTNGTGWVISGAKGAEVNKVAVQAKLQRGN